MKSYYRIMLGRQSVHAQECREKGFIGADFGIEQNLSSHLSEDWKAFNRQFIPIFLSGRPDKTKVTAGLACGALWTIAKGLQVGDIVLCPNGEGAYFVGEVAGEYAYKKGENLPHRRPVRWSNRLIARDQMSEGLRNSTGSIGTVSTITKFSEEIERLIGGPVTATIVSTDDSIRDPSAFALEKHLEEFLVHNWEHTDLGKKYEIYQEDGELVGQQYPTDTGPIDILAISKDKKELLVVELKKGRASDHVVGQIQRYMGYVIQELAEEGQSVRGLIIALDEDLSIKRALTVAKSIDFYRYQVSFRLLRSAA